MKEKLTDQRVGEGFGQRALDLRRIGAEMQRQRKLTDAGSMPEKSGDTAPVAPVTGDASVSVLPNIGSQATTTVESQPVPVVEPKSTHHNRW